MNVLAQINTVNNNFPVEKLCTQCIRITYPCKVYPIEPHFYTAKLGYAGVYLFFIIFAAKHTCRLWVLGSNVNPQSMFERVPTIFVLSKTTKIIKKKKSAENFQFLKQNNIGLLHGQGFVM